MNSNYLVIDEGNSHIKAGVFASEAKDWIAVKNAPSHEEEFLCAQLKQWKPEAAMVSSVKRSPDFWQTHFPDTQWLVAGAHLKLPFDLAYEKPETLGGDRLAGAMGAWARDASVAALVIDMGTCINYEYLCPENGYLGGKISPGMAMRFQSMHQFTAALPLPNWRKTQEHSFPGRSSKDCLWQGVFQGVEAELKITIDQFLQNYPNGKIYLTGGDGPRFAHLTKNHIFAAPLLVLEGLAALLRPQWI